jgi:hypothetical protein
MAAVLASYQDASKSYASYQGRRCRLAGWYCSLLRWARRRHNHLPHHATAPRCCAFFYPTCRCFACVATRLLLPLRYCPPFSCPHNHHLPTRLLHPYCGGVRARHATAPHTTARHGTARHVTQAGGEFVDTVGVFGETALYRSVVGGSLATSRLLLRAGGDANAHWLALQDTHGSMLLDCVARVRDANKLQLTRLLVEHGVRCGSARVWVAVCVCVRVCVSVSEYVCACAREPAVAFPRVAMV